MVKYVCINFIVVMHLFITIPATYSQGIDKDRQGSHDHPLFPRIRDAIIIGYEHSDYDLAEFVTVWEKNSNPYYHEVEGKRTRLAYVAPAGVSTIQILRSYQQAFSDIGEVDERYQCRKAKYCKRLVPKKDAQLDLSTAHHICAGSITPETVKPLYTDMARSMMVSPCFMSLCMPLFRTRVNLI
jgi:hypothetical protein